jgi:hypothetical protein
VHRHADRSIGVLWIVSGAFFLESSRIRLNLLAACERLIYVDHVRYVWLMAIHGLSKESMCRVGQVLPCTVYIDLNRHDSWISISLVRGSHHIVN